MGTGMAAPAAAAAAQAAAVMPLPQTLTDVRCRGKLEEYVLSQLVNRHVSIILHMSTHTHRWRQAVAEAAEAAQQQRWQGVQQHGSAWCTHEWLDGWMAGWLDGWIAGCIHSHPPRCTLTSRHANTTLNLPRTHPP